MISFLDTKVKADYSKLAYDFKFNDLDGSELNLIEPQHPIAAQPTQPQET